MSRIKNWKSIEKNVWQNKISGRVITLHYERDWEEPWLAELYKNYQLFFSGMIGNEFLDTIGYYSNKSDALYGVSTWMRKHPEGKYISTVKK